MLLIMMIMLMIIMLLLIMRIILKMKSTKMAVLIQIDILRKVARKVAWNIARK